MIKNIIKDFIKEIKIKKVKRFIKNNCKINKKGQIFMNDCYLTALCLIGNNEYTLNDNFISFMIKHKITKVYSYKDFSNIDSPVACIGFSKKEQKWYGWSHRAVYGFGIGYVAEKGDCCTTSSWTDEYLKEHPEADLSVPVGFEVKTLDDAKRCAIAFAESVN